MARIDHTTHDHPTTPAARALCRAGAELVNGEDGFTFGTPLGKIRVGSVLRARLRGATTETTVMVTGFTTRSNGVRIDVNTPDGTELITVHQVHAVIQP